MRRAWWLVAAGGAGVLAAGVGAVARLVSARAVALPAVVVPETRLPKSPARSVLPSGRRDHFAEAWTIGVPGLRDMALSPGGGTVAWTDGNGTVRRILGESGRLVWRTRAPLLTVNRVIAADSGMVAAYSRLNPDRTSLTLLRPGTGDLAPDVWSGSGAIWSAAFDASGGVWVGTGGARAFGAASVAGRGIYRVGRTPVDPQFPAAGLPESLAVAGSAARVAWGTWAPAGVTTCAEGASGGGCWTKTEPDVDRADSVMVSADGGRVAVLSARGARRTDGQVCVYAGKTGALLYAAALPAGAFDPDARFAADGSLLAVTYRRGGIGGDAGAAWKLAVFDAAGRRRFPDKGSALFRPRIAALAGDGSAITVQSGDDTLFTLDRSGNFVSEFRLTADPQTGKPGTIRRVLATRDGRTLLLFCRGDKLTLLRTNR